MRRNCPKPLSFFKFATLLEVMSDVIVVEVYGRLFVHSEFLSKPSVIIIVKEIFRWTSIDTLKGAMPLIVSCKSVYDVSEVSVSGV